MSLSKITPYNPTYEASFLFQKQCPDFVSLIWNGRKMNDSVKCFVESVVNWEVVKSPCDFSSPKKSLFETVKQFFNFFLPANSGSSSRDLCYKNISKVEVFKKQELSWDEFKKIPKYSRDYFVSKLRRESDADQYQRIERRYDYFFKNKHSNRERGVQYSFPLSHEDLETIEDREFDEYFKSFNTRPQLPAKKLQDCIATDLSLLPLNDFDPSKGAYRFLRSSLSFGDSDFLSRVDELLAFKELKIIESGISTSLMIYDEEGNPFAIFKPSSFAGGSLENPKATTAMLPQDIVEQAALKEIAASKVMNSLSGAPETHLVEMNLGGKILEGSLQKFIPHERSAVDVLVEIQKAGSDAMGFNIPKDFLSKLNHGQLFGRADPQIADEFSKFMNQLINSSWGMYTFQNSLKKIYEFMEQIPLREVQEVALHQLIAGNMDINPQNFLLKENPEGGQQFIPIDFNLSFLKERSPQMGILGNSFWSIHPLISQPLDDKILKYFESYDVLSMADQLRAMGLDEARVVNFILRGTLIQKAVSKNLSLSLIANLFIPKIIKGLSLSSGVEFEKTLFEELSTGFYDKYDQALTKSDQEQAVEHFKKQAGEAIVSLQERLQDSNSFEGKLARLTEAAANAKSLREFDLSLKESHDLIGSHHVFPNFEYATEQEIQSDEEQMCFNGFAQ